MLKYPPGMEGRLEEGARNSLDFALRATWSMYGIEDPPGTDRPMVFLARIGNPDAHALRGRFFIEEMLP